MYEKTLNGIRAWLTAFHAGWIAHRCKTGCVVDDKTESIYPCLIHRKKIEELGEKNERYNKTFEN